MDTDHDLSPVDAAEIEWEQDRQATLRTFHVVLSSGDIRRIMAHFWSTENAGGHWQFITIQPSGRQLITSAYGCEYVVEVIETTPHDVAVQVDRIVAKQAARHAGRKATDRMKTSSRMMH